MKIRTITLGAAAAAIGILAGFGSRRAARRLAFRGPWRPLSRRTVGLTSPGRSPLLTVLLQ